VAKVPLAPGKWMLHVEARAADGTLYRRRIDLRVEG
jgi:nitrogen fixation protein FixH